MKLNLCFILLNVVLIAKAADALQALPAHENALVTARMAQSDVNRITLDHDRIKSVKGLTGYYQLQTEGESGDVFIMPLRHTKPFTLFIRSEKGFHVQLRVLPAPIPAETVLIQPIATLTEPLLYETRLLAFIKRLEALPLPAVKSVNTNALLQVVPLAHVQEDKWRAEIDALCNNGQTLRVLSPLDFYTPATQALVFKTRHLLPKQTTLLYRIVQ